MKLYTFDLAPNPRRVNLFLAYKGVQLPIQQVDLRVGEQLSEAYRAISPRCIVPVLQLDDGSFLADSIAICWYLESRYPHKPLLGINPLQQAQILSWDQYIFTDGFTPVTEALRNRSQAFKHHALSGAVCFEQIPALEERGRKRLPLFWSYLDQNLKGRDFLVGDALTLADIDAFVVVDFAGWIKEGLPESYLHLRSWYQRIKALLPVG